MQIILGRKEVVATVFVPWDCMNNCKFCETKKEYKEKYKRCNLEENIKRVCASIDSVGKSPFITEYVFTGGEPLLDVERLTELLCHVPIDKKAYINTSLAFGKSEFAAKKIEDALSFLEDDETNVTGVSVSCPLSKSFDWDLSLWSKRKFAVPVRINCVVDGTEDSFAIFDFLENVKTSGFSDNEKFNGIVFRKDYTKTTQSSLNNCNDRFFKTLMSMNEFEYMGGGGCLVCRSDEFETKYGHITYHRGVNDTHLVFGEKLMINDFVIKQDGEIRFDWNDKCKMTDAMLDSLGMKCD